MKSYWAVPIFMVLTAITIPFFAPTGPTYVMSPNELWQGMLLYSIIAGIAMTVLISIGKLIKAALRAMILDLIKDK